MLHTLWTNDIRRFWDVNIWNLYGSSCIEVIWNNLVQSHDQYDVDMRDVNN